MAGTVRVTDAELKRVEDEIERVSGSMAAQLVKLNAAIDGLEGQWKGIGAGAFNTQQEEINRRHQKLRVVIDGIKEAIVATRAGHGNTDEEVLEDLKKIDINGAAGGSGIAGL
ncbi:WXG100 family type VII secretion target [Streptomyces sp. RKAG337]|uniref:WXG100 family type VII secretion target n=1 Tax=Streptomyces sp. RKAG337 TaxID=2893404 RepID=UPI0020347843|nr:WXG100 family type VII secretion target [Streptomyces sp. RKAG337]MCM2425795.1 WXG100 family type VII secretion target [Streptomyces sp. RKAG337]